MKFVYSDGGRSKYYKGVLIVKLSHHLSCVKNGVLYDIYDCTRDGNRCVYGYWLVDE
jgi:hypothetical protein